MVSFALVSKFSFRFCEGLIVAHVDYKEKLKKELVTRELAIRFGRKLTTL
jgi:hypothetical protein